MNKLKKLLILALAAVLLLTTGCQLAQPEFATGGDNLIGVFITTEYLDTVDWDNISYRDLTSGKISGGKLYGTIEDWELSFPGITGVYMVSLTEEDQDGPYGYTTHNGVDNVRISESSTDNGSSTSMTGAIHYDRSGIVGSWEEFTDKSYIEKYGENANVRTLLHEDGTETYEVARDGVELVFYANPVYQQADGQIYTVTGSGFSVSRDGQSSTSISNKNTVTLDGETSEEEVKFTVEYVPTDIFESAVVTQFDAEHQVISTLEFDPETVPESIRREPGCAYMLAALAQPDGSVVYELINNDAAWYYVYTSSPTLVVKAQSIEIVE